MNVSSHCNYFLKTICCIYIFRSITASYFRNCAGVLLVFDLTKRSSFHHIPDWMKECKQHNFHNVTFALIGHKADLEQHREVTTREVS